MSPVVRGGVEVNPGPLDDVAVAQIEKICERMCNAMGNKIIESIEIAEKKNEERHEEWKLMRGEINETKNQMNEIKKDMVRIDMMERELKRKNVIIFGMDSRRGENKQETCFNVMQLLANYMGIRIDEEGIDNCYWLGRRVGRRPLLVRFTRGITRDEVLERTRYLKGSNIWVEQDYNFETIRIRKELMPYLREARRNGKRASLKGSKLKIGNQLYDLEFCRRNLRKEETRNMERRGSWSQTQNRGRSVSQERRRESRNRSVSPGVSTLTHRVQQPEMEAGAWNVMMTQRETAVAGASQQEVTFWSNEERGEGKQTERMRHSKSPVLGNIQRQTRRGNEGGGYYFRSGTNRRT